MLVKERKGEFKMPDPKLEESIKIIKLYQKMANAFYELNSEKLTKERLKFREDFNNVLNFALSTLIKVKEGRLVEPMSEEMIYAQLGGLNVKTMGGLPQELTDKSKEFIAKILSGKLPKPY